MKKFKEEFLRDVLKFNKEEIELVLECQKIFPELLDNQAKEIDSVKKLYDKIGMDKSHWSSWYKRNIENNEFFKENEDWWVLATCATTEKGGQVGKDFSITVDFAKHLVMESKSKKAHKFRNYFIYIERAVSGLQDHITVREPEKENYNKMKLAILKDYSEKHSEMTKMDEQYLMIRECNLINVSLTGYKAFELKDLLGYKDKETREHLEIQINKAIDRLQMMIQGLVIGGADFDERKKIIENICKKEYPNLKINK